MRYSIAIEPQIPECHVEIHCSQVSREVEGILQALVLTETTVAGQAGAETKFVPISQVLYFESVDDKTYLYTHVRYWPATCVCTRSRKSWTMWDLSGFPSPWWPICITCMPSGGNGTEP